MKKYFSSLQIRFVLALFAFSLAMAGASALLEIRLEFQQGVGEIQRSFDRARATQLPTLAQNLWRFDEEAIRLQMDSISQTESFIGIHVQDRGGASRWVGNRQTSGHLYTAIYPLEIQNGRGSVESIGTLELYASDEHLRELIRNRMPRILLSALAATFSGALFMLFLFQIMIGRHLTRIGAYASGFSPQSLGEPLRLARRSRQGRPDELEALVTAINGMTDRIRAELSERRQSERLVAVKNRELEQIVYVASHDLRSPLVNVDGYSRELEYSLEDVGRVIEGGTPDASLRAELADMRNALRLIRNSTQQMDALLKGLLTLSRSGRATLSVGRVDMNALLARLVGTLDYRIREFGARVEVEALPPCQGDVVQLSRVFDNLIGNALKFRDPNRPCIVRIGGSLEQSRAVYRVEDNGIGIAPEHQERIFELFHRLNPSATEGDGLGLTIVRQILLRLDGEIRVESRPGSGSRFYVSLPAGPVQADPAQGGTDEHAG